MDIFNVLTMIGGLCLFLFGMNIMGQALERRAGDKLRLLLGKLTTGKAAGLLTGLGVTAVVQSSSAVTVMVVGFVNSGLMTLKQAINVIMGDNIGTTVTAWILSLAGIDSGNIFVKLLKPSSFTPVLALIGIIFYMFCKNSKKKDTGMILLGFATLMFGMETMSGAVSGLGSIPAFQNLFILFKNPVLGLLAGAVLISFNVIGSAVWLAVFCVIKAVFSPVLLNESASLFGIAASHSAFHILCTILMLPLTGFLEKLVNKLIPDTKQQEIESELDERLLATPSIALERCHEVAVKMAKTAVETLTEGLNSLRQYTPELAASIHKKEEITDCYEDMPGTYLVHLSTKQISEHMEIIYESAEWRQKEAVILFHLVRSFKRRKCSSCGKQMTKN